MKQELAWHKDFFDKVEKQPLTDLQRKAIILNEQRNLVIAGAGTGKTSTIIGKIGYTLNYWFLPKYTYTIKLF